MRLLNMYVKNIFLCYVYWLCLHVCMCAYENWITIHLV